MNSRSSHPFANMMFANPFNSAVSDPGRWRICTVAMLARSIWRGSATINNVPLRTARRIRVPITGCCSVVFDPITKIARASSKSAMLFVIAPDPKAVARPVTVAACQRRAQWSTLFVPITARVNFWIR